MELMLLLLLVVGEMGALLLQPAMVLLFPWIMVGADYVYSEDSYEVARSIV